MAKTRSHQIVDPARRSVKNVCAQETLVLTNAAFYDVRRANFSSQADVPVILGVPAMQSKAKTVEDYLATLPADRRATIEAVRKVILANIDGDIEEGMQYGMIGYYVPHRVYPAGYHCDPQQPLPYVCLASQKNYMSLYLMTAYGNGEHLRWFEKAWANAGKKLNMGKSCLRFKSLDDLALNVLAEAIRRVPAKAHIAQYESVIARPGKRPARGTAKSRKAPAASSRGKAKPARRKTRSAR
jgi:Domain of unknown function (DU1801)